MLITQDNPLATTGIQAKRKTKQKTSAQAIKSQGHRVGPPETSDNHRDTLQRAEIQTESLGQELKPPLLSQRAQQLAFSFYSTGICNR